MNTLCKQRLLHQKILIKKLHSKVIKVNFVHFAPLFLCRNILYYCQNVQTS